jgi:hypothetical protein
MNTTQVNKIISNNEEKIYSITGTREEIKIFILRDKRDPEFKCPCQIRWSENCIRWLCIPKITIDLVELEDKHADNGCADLYFENNLTWYPGFDAFDINGQSVTYMFADPDE